MWRSVKSVDKLVDLEGWDWNVKKISMFGVIKISLPCKAIILFNLTI